MFSWLNRSLIYSLLWHVVLWVCLLGVFSHTPSRPVSADLKQPTLAANTVDSAQVARQIKSIEAARHQRDTQQQKKLRSLASQLRRMQANKIRVTRQLKKLDQQKVIVKQALRKRNRQLTAEKKKIAAAKVVALKAKKNLKDLKKKRSTLLKKKQQALAEALRQRVMAQEKKQLQAAQNALIARAVGRFGSQIKAAIQQTWAVPPDVSRQLSCLFLIDLADNGTVLSVTLLKSSGSSVLDRSARVAVMKASPLPVPKDPVYMAKFRHFHLTLRPSQIVG